MTLEAETELNQINLRHCKKAFGTEVLRRKQCPTLLSDYHHDSYRGNELLPRVINESRRRKSLSVSLLGV